MKISDKCITLRRMQTIFFALIALLILSHGSKVYADSNKDYVWLEGEATSSINVKPNISGWGHKEFLSGEKWLQISIDADKIDKELPAEGGILQYKFSLNKTGQYEVWNRIGYEFVRSLFEWRIDNGAWNRVEPDRLTTDLMELQDWNEVAWLKMGDQSLTLGAHKLQIHLPKTKDAKGHPLRVLYASDAICIYPGAFYPNSKYKPDENYRDSKDADAEKKIYELPTPTTGGKRTSIPLNGLWEVCRNDEQTPGETAAPIKDFPKHPYWKAISVPGDKMQRPELVMAHRLWYRTKINIPAGYTNRSFHIVFPQNNLNTTVYLNGVYCGFNKNPFARFEIDVTKGVKPGVNELWVGIKDAYYGYSARPTNPMKLRKVFNLPLSFTHNGFQDLAYPVWNAFQSGILVTPEFVASGQVYASDVFVKPSVSKKELAAEVTLSNPTAKPLLGTVEWQAVNIKTGAIEKVFPPKEFSLAPGADKTLQLTGAWDNPKLWWPDEPNLYQLRTTVMIGGSTALNQDSKHYPADVTETTFGFREWTIDGTHFKLNGVVFHGFQDAHGDGSPDEWLTLHRKTHQSMMRFWGTEWKGMEPNRALDWFDKNGVVVRRQGMLDGEAIGYNAIENDLELKKLYNSDIKMDLMRNWQDQMVAQVKGERNHPSVMLWSIENEWLYINCINLYGGLMDKFEEAVAKTSQAVSKADPTRTNMSDGGGANRDNSMPVHGNHYVFGPIQAYPALAYEDNVNGGSRGRWTWDKKRPRFLGEDFFFAGNHPELSYIGGEAAFAGKQASLPASSLLQRILHEGYRWADYAAWDLYVQPNDGDGSQYNSLSPRAILCREWDWTFGSAQTVKRHFKIFNDTHDPTQIYIRIRLITATGIPYANAKFYKVAPGESVEIERDIQMPSVTERQEAKLELILKVNDVEQFHDEKQVSILPDTRQLPAGQKLALFDPSGKLSDYLKSRAIPFTSLSTLQNLPPDERTLIIGKDALDTAESASSRLAAYAVEGHSVIVLEQKNPLKYQALPAQIETAENVGRTGFAEDLAHPIFKGLSQKDFFTWGPDEIVYRNAYLKPTRGAKSLLQCDNLLQNSALVEVPVGKGVLLLSQLALEEKIDSNAVAQTLLSNMISYSDSYKLTYRSVTADLPDNSPIDGAIDAIGLNYTKSGDPLKAISKPGTVAVIAATPENLHMLAKNIDRVHAFNETGGWIIFNGLTPEGLADYNKIVGFDHMIRPFKRERVTFPLARSPLTAGIPTGDIVMYSSKRVFDYQEGNYVVSDEFNYVVDIDEVAPFGKSPFFAYDNITNNFVSADGWPLIINYPIPASGPSEIPISLPKPQTITEFTWVGNTFYYPQTKVNLVFEGLDGKKEKVEFTTLPNAEPQTFVINPPRTAQNITLQVADWIVKPNMAPNIGIDNIYFKAQRPADFAQKVRPMLNIGGMVEYPRGQGGIVLCNLNFKNSEETPENLTKKRNIIATLLRNLKAPFSTGTTVIAGANLKYTPIDISKQANQYRDDRGWFGDKNFTFKDLPTGKHTFAGVPYQVYDFPTSPVPTVIMLGGGGIPNNPAQEVMSIPVNQKASALFFLQTARIDNRRNRDELKQNKKYEMVRYVIHYADGQTLNIPVYSELDVDDYRQKTPMAIPGAQIAWTQAYAGTDQTAVAYSKQWDNPRPDVAIQSIDMVYGTDRRGIPVLIAVTAASN